MIVTYIPRGLICEGGPLFISLSPLKLWYLLNIMMYINMNLNVFKFE